MLENVREKLAADENTLAALRAFEVYFPPGDQAVGFGAADRALADSGYRLVIIHSPEFKSFQVGTASMSLRAPLPIWYRRARNGWSVEVFGYHDFKAKAETRKTGLQKVLGDIVDVKNGATGFNKAHKEFADSIVV